MAKSRYDVVKPRLSSDNKVKSYYAHIAKFYDFFTRFVTFHHQKAINMAGIKKGYCVLEVACGTGKATVELAKAVGPSGRVEALDLSEDMIKKAERKVKHFDLISRVAFKQGNAKQLPYKDNTFDILYNSYMLELFPDKQFEFILAEFKRVLKQNGTLVLVNMSKNKKDKIFYEKFYEKGLTGACRPVMLASFLKKTGFKGIKRIYCKNNFLFIPLSFGTEIITAKKH